MKAVLPFHGFSSATGIERDAISKHIESLDTGWVASDGWTINSPLSAKDPLKKNASQNYLFSPGE